MRQRYKKFFKEKNSDEYDLNSKYKEFNHLYFNNELDANLPVTWSNRIGGSVIGQYFPKQNRIEISNKKDMMEIELDSTLVHEMIHALQQKRNQHDIHGSSFKKEADRINRIRPELKIDTKHQASIKNDVLINQNELKIIPIYMLFSNYGNQFGTKLLPLTSQNASDVQFFSYTSDIEKKVIDLIEKHMSGSYFLFKVNTNTSNFLYDDYKKFLDKYIRLTSKYIKHLATFIRKDRENIQLVAQYTKDYQKNITKI